METTGYKNLWIVTDEQLKAIRANVGLHSVEDINEIIDLIVDWFKMQPHLPKIELDRRLVEFIMIQRKGSVERVKAQIDALFTLKTKMPEMISPRDISHSLYQKFRHCAHLSALPRLDDNNSRVFILHITNEDLTDFSLEVFVKLVFMCTEFRLIHDLSSSDHYIFNPEKAGFEFLKKLTLSTIKKGEILYQKGYSIRFAGIHLLKCGKIAEEAAKLLRMGMSAKLGQRVFIHSDYESLYKMIPRRILPMDYGGDEVSIKELSDRMFDEFEKPEVKKYLEESETWTTDETQRLEDLPDDGSMSVPGTFRKLQVD